MLPPSTTQFTFDNFSVEGVADATNCVTLGIYAYGKRFKAVCNDETFAHNTIYHPNIQSVVCRNRLRHAGGAWSVVHCDKGDDDIGDHDYREPVVSTQPATPPTPTFILKWLQKASQGRKRYTVLTRLRNGFVELSIEKKGFEPTKYLSRVDIQAV